MLDNGFGIIFGFMILFIFFCIAIQVLFILAQTKLIDSLKIKNNVLTTNHILCWMQLFPILNYFGLYFFIKNCKEQYNCYIEENNVTLYQFKSEYGYISLISGILNLITYNITGLFALISFVFFILFWINIHNVYKSVLTSYKE